MRPLDSDRRASVDAVRAFNRFYTRRIGLLAEKHLESTLTLAQVRVLYEVAHGDGVSPSGLARGLGLDAGYVSRTIAALERRRLVSRSASTEDARRSLLVLTRTGRTTIAALERATHDQLASLLTDLSAEGARRLVEAMHAIERLLDPAAVDPVTIRDPRPGDLGWIIHRQAVVYATEYGWDWTYEGLIAGICGRFVEGFDPERERCWVAARGDRIVGSVFLVRKSNTVGQLRLLYVEADARGLGLGARLVDECIAFARAAGYRRMTLWTNDVLVSARRIYEAAGFVLTGEERHRSFGKDLVGQQWALDLRTATSRRPAPASASPVGTTGPRGR